MFKNIKKEKEQIWNERFQKRMKDMGLSQRKFISKYKEKYGTGSQADVSKWMHVGDIDGRTKKRRGFPSFETILNIADILDVSVGYLIGETDYETFDLEKTSKYIGLSSTTVTALRNITSGKAIPPFYDYPDGRRTVALERFIENSHLVDYLKDICDLAESINRESNPEDLYKKALDKIPEIHRENVIALLSDAERAVEAGINPTEELWTYVSLLDTAAYEETYQPEIAAREIKAARYALQEIHTKIIDEIVVPERLEELLPHYATREELEDLLKKH